MLGGRHIYTPKHVIEESSLGKYSKRLGTSKGLLSEMLTYMIG